MSKLEASLTKYGREFGIQTKPNPPFSASSPIDRTEGQDSRRKRIASLRKPELSLNPIVWEEHLSPPPVDNLGFHESHSQNWTQHHIEKPWPLKASCEIRRRPAPVSAHHSKVPKDCEGAIIELNAVMMATAAGTLGTDAALVLALESGSDFFGGGAFE